MTEEDYIKVTNKTRIVAAVECLRDVMCGEEYGIDDNAYKEIMVTLLDLQRKCFDSIEVK